MPDAELLKSDLRDPQVLKAQARRMVRDPRIRGFATEFAGHWLDFRRFEEHNAVDRDRFPQFTNELRQAMFEEPIRYVEDIARRNRPVLDLLYGQDTFVNGTLAKHYGMPPVGDWPETRRPSTAGAAADGGVPHRNAPDSDEPRETRLPGRPECWRGHPPPPTVPTLPKDEATLGELTPSPGARAT
jgi:hypothetical protein